MVDTLVSGASASRHVGSSPILGTKKEQTLVLLFFYAHWATIFTFPPNLPLPKGGYKLLLINTLHPIAKKILLFFYAHWATIFTFPPNLPLAKGDYKLLLINTIHLIAKNLALFLCPLGNV